MDLTGVTLAGEALVLLILAIKNKSNFTCYLAVSFASISLPLAFIGA